MKEFEARVRGMAGAAVIDMRGDLDGTGLETLNRAYGQAEHWGSGAILLNFESVDYINSKGIALIVGLLKAARQSRRRLLACGLSEHYVRIFEITRLADYIEIYPGEEQALSHVTSASP